MYVCMYTCIVKYVFTSKQEHVCVYATDIVIVWGDRTTRNV